MSDESRNPYRAGSSIGDQLTAVQTRCWDEGFAAGRAAAEEAA